MKVTPSPAKSILLLMSSTDDDGIKKNGMIIHVLLVLPLSSCVQQAICVCVDEPQIDNFYICINCNWLAHERCVKPIVLQILCNLNLALSVEDLDKAAKERPSSQSCPTPISLQLFCAFFVRCA
jgi:hypothetical protein